MSRDEVVAVICGAGVRKLWNGPASSGAALHAHRIPLRDHPCLPNLPEGVRATSHFLVNVRQLSSTESSAFGAAAHPILGVSLDYAV